MQILQFLDLNMADSALPVWFDAWPCVCMGPCPVWSSTDIIVTQITTVVFGNIATVTSQLLLHHARHCIGCKWLMDQMCSKCKKHCFSHDLQKISELRNFRKFQNFRKFLKKILSEFVFFSKNFFFDKKVFSDNYFSKEFFIAFQTITLY